MAEYTAPPAPPEAVLLHGFTQTGGSWRPLLPYLAGIPVLTPDLPGHGACGQVAADLWRTSDLLAGLVDEPATWAGYSMGGRAALHVALAHPHLVRRLVLISATAGIEDQAERQARRTSDEELAVRAETDGVEPFVDWWLSRPLFATLAPERSDREGRLANTGAGLASSLRLAGAGSQRSLWDRLVELGRRRLPVLCLAGELDTKYVAIAQAMAEAVGTTAEVVIVEEAGHACHLERPEIVGPAVAQFARRPRPSEGDAGRQ